MEVYERLFVNTVDIEDGHSQACGGLRTAVREHSGDLRMGTREQRGGLRTAVRKP